jgi:hypothetical protein
MTTTNGADGEGLRGFRAFDETRVVNSTDGGESVPDEGQTPAMGQDDELTDLFDTPEEEDVHQHKTLREIYDDITSREFSARQRFFQIIHGTPVMTPDDIIAVGYNALIILTVLASTVSFIVETMPEFYNPGGSIGTFFVLESVWVGVFTADLLLRFVSATHWKFVINIQVVFDILSVIGYYVSLGVDDSSNANLVTLQALRMLRLTRVLRMAKLSRNGVGFTLLTRTAKKSKQGLLLMMVLVAIAVVLCAAAFYSVETQTGRWDTERRRWLRPNGKVSPFQSIPGCFWYVAATLTTVGYGDQVPSQSWGRIVAVVIMFCGVLFLSFPNILIGSNFQQVHESWQRQRARDQLGRRFRFVRYVVRFVRMWRDYRKNGRMKLLQSASAYMATAYEGHASDSLQAQDTVALVKRDRSIEKRNANLFRRTVNFFFRPVDFAEFDYAGTFAPFNQGHFDHFSVRGLETTEFLHRLVEIFSCCCTIEEMYESLLLHPVPGCTVKQSDLAELSCHLANSGILEVYVINRFEDHMLIHLSKKGLKNLLHFGEVSTLPCVRCVAEAQEIWHATTSTVAPIVFPVDGFRHWQEMQATVPKRSKLGFIYDLKEPEAKGNSTFRGSRALLARQVAMAQPRIKVKRRSTTTAPLPSGCCIACVHCLARGLDDRPKTESDLSGLETFLLLQRKLIEEQLEILSLQRELLRTQSPLLTQGKAASSEAIIHSSLPHQVADERAVHGHDNGSAYGPVAFEKDSDDTTKRSVTEPPTHRRNSWDDDMNQSSSHNHPVI